MLLGYENPPLAPLGEGLRPAMSVLVEGLCVGDLGDVGTAAIKAGKTLDKIQCVVTKASGYICGSNLSVSVTTMHTTVW